MNQEPYIISSCVISNNLVLRNNRIIFSSDAENLQSFLSSVYHFLKIDYPKFYKMDNLGKLGWLCSEVLLKDESIIKQFQPHEIGIVLMNANSSLDTDLKYFQTIKAIPSPALFVYTLPNIVIGEICIRNKFTGENAFFVSDKFDGGFIEQYVGGLLSNSILNICICGWVDVLDENYKAALFLVTKNNTSDALLFAKQHLDNLFNSIQE